jgi:hypothetical protein
MVRSLFGFACAGILLITGLALAQTAAQEKWVVAIDGFCKDGMVKDAKEEMSVGKSEFDKYCKTAGKKTAVDARCTDKGLEVKCR